jgi:hypothetical protein
MSGDYSRDSFDTLRNFAGVFLQQGRAVLDSDWNELVETFDRRIRAETVDIIGRAVVPRETEHAFEVRLISDGFEFGRGRMYVDGMLAESFGWADFDGTDPNRPAPVIDRGRPGDDGPEGVLDEMISPLEGDYTSYFNQPYWPTPADLPDGGPHLVYVVVWQREVTPTEMPELLEPALGGLDTTTRWQTVWQVRVLGNVDDGATCQTPDENLAGWIDEIAPSTARLSTGTVDVEDPEDPCLVPPTEGYTGLENQFYRVEIHDLFDPETATDQPAQGDWGFKFSRENASVRASVNSIASDAESVTVARIGRDEVLRFRPGDWAEITDNHREFNHRSGQMLRVADVDPETREIEFESAIDADLVPTGADGDTVTARRTRLIRWDQRGIVRLDDGTQWADLDAEGSNGLIRVPPDGSTIVLESGITVTFSTADGPGRFRQMDHWRFAARTAGTQVEILRAAPPDGVQRHHARLAVVTPGGPNTVGEVLDCRTFWPPLFEGGGEGCACTVCVTAEGHNSGALTIQAAIELVGTLGGTVCLEAGLYVLSEPVEITGRGAITLSGQGLGTILAYRGDGGAVRVTRSADVRLERFTILAAPGGEVPVHGVAAINTMLLEVQRLAVVIAAPNPEDRADFGIALDGTQVGTKIEECLAIAPNALGSRSSYGLDEDGDMQFAAFAELRVLDCILFGGRAGVLIERSAINIAAAILSRNLVLSLGVGVRINWAEIPAASLSVDASTVVANRTGVIVSAGTMRVQDCEISGGDEAGDGITLAPNILPQTLASGQIIGNTIYDLAGAGIRISAAHDILFIKRNIIRDTGDAGIVTDPAATVRHLAVDNNAIERIGIDTGGSSIGIGLTSVESAQVVGNSIRAVGNAGGNGQIHVGIGVQGVGSVDISQNVLSEIGGQQLESTSVGIFGTAPYLGLTLGSNRIFGQLDESEERTDWRAIRIGDLIPDNALDVGDPGTIFAGAVGALPTAPAGSYAFVNVQGDTWAASAENFAVVLPARTGQVSASANQVRSAQRSIGAIVSIAEPGGTLSFAGNQCDLRSGGGLREVVLLASPAVSAQGNMITHSTDATSLRILTGRAGRATPVGNITSAGLSVHPAGLNAPFDALNLNI